VVATTSTSFVPPTGTRVCSSRAGGLQAADLVGDLAQGGIGDVLTPDDAAVGHAEEDLATGAVQEGAGGLEARLELARRLLEIEPLRYALGDQCSEFVDVHGGLRTVLKAILDNRTA
jgi:hypothetical protein